MCAFERDNGKVKETFHLFEVMTHNPAREFQEDSFKLGSFKSLCRIRGSCICSFDLSFLHSRSCKVDKDEVKKGSSSYRVLILAYASLSSLTLILESDRRESNRSFH